MTDEDCDKIIELCWWHLGTCELADCIIDCCDIMRGDMNDQDVEIRTLSEMNKALRDDLDYFKAKNGSLETGMFNLERENEQLKQQREELFIRERDTKNEWRELKQENEQLKQEIETLQEQLAHFDIGDDE